MSVQKVTDQDFEEKVLKSKSPVMVDFYADWCGPCKMAEPVLEELSDEYEGKATIVKMNVDENKKPAEYDVMSIPTTVMIKDGQEVARQVGFAGKGAFEELLKKGI